LPETRLEGPHPQRTRARLSATYLCRTGPAGHRDAAGGGLSNSARPDQDYRHLQLGTYGPAQRQDAEYVATDLRGRPEPTVLESHPKRTRVVRGSKARTDQAPPRSSRHIGRSPAQKPGPKTGGQPLIARSPTILSIGAARAHEMKTWTRCAVGSPASACARKRKPARNIVLNFTRTRRPAAPGAPSFLVKKHPSVRGVHRGGLRGRRLQPDTGAGASNC